MLRFRVFHSGVSNATLGVAHQLWVQLQGLHHRSGAGAGQPDYAEGREAAPLAGRRADAVVWGRQRRNWKNSSCAVLQCAGIDNNSTWLGLQVFHSADVAQAFV